MLGVWENFSNRFLYEKVTTKLRYILKELVTPQSLQFRCTALTKAWKDFCELD